MSCCNNCPPNPIPLLQKNDGTYPNITIPFYRIFGTVSGGSPECISPVFLADPGSNVPSIRKPILIDVNGQSVTVHLWHPTTPSNFMTRGGPFLNPTSCVIRTSTSSSESTEQKKLASIAASAQNGTYCSAPMSSSEYLQYKKATQSALPLYYDNSCCC